MITLQATNDFTVCTRCISSSIINGIYFDEQGVCNYCKMHDDLSLEFPTGPQAERNLAQVVARMRQDGKGRGYDCVVGVSGGRDSTFTLYLAVKLGLRPLAVHFDNGWNSKIAVSNIKKAVTRLNVDLYTHVADWEEFKALQIAFLRASVSDAEVPTDVAIHGTLHQVAAREGIRHIINGHSFRTEGMVPLSWTYMDGRYINAINKRFGSGFLKTVPNFGLWDYLYFSFIKRIKVVPLLNYVEYKHKDVDELLAREVGWEYYGGHHHESYYTKFFQSYYLPTKFRIDKRMLEYSALIRSGQISREEAKQKMTVPYKFSEELIDYTLRKLGLSLEEFSKIMAEKPKSFKDYPSYYSFIRLFKQPLRLASKVGLVPSLLYQKFFA